MMVGKTSEKPSTSSCVRTITAVEKFKKIPDGWGGQETKKPTAKAIRKLKKILEMLESGHMPWPTISVVSNGGFMLTWISLTRDMMMTVDPEGDVQFATALKKIDIDTCEIIERLDSEGIVTDLVTIDQMMAWYCTDKASNA